MQQHSFEYELLGPFYTSPTNPNTDNEDGNDDENFNPCGNDLDGDGIPDGEDEYPTLSDGDNDYLEDGKEEAYGCIVGDDDTDDDGLKDGEEVYGLLGYVTDPANPNSDDEFDLYGEYWSDGEEVLEYHTDPTVKDTDGDGVNDIEDVEPLADAHISFNIPEITIPADYWSLYAPHWRPDIIIMVNVSLEYTKYFVIPYDSYSVYSITHIILNKPFVVDIPDSEYYYEWGQTVMYVGLLAYSQNQQIGWIMDLDYEYGDGVKKENVDNVRKLIKWANKNILQYDEFLFLTYTYGEKSSYEYQCDLIGTWDGNDYKDDYDGYGYTSGLTDGVGNGPYLSQIAASMHFTITQTDIDNDGRYYWQEVYYGTDPTQPITGRLFLVYMDADNDLTDYALKNINEMEMFGSKPPYLNVVVLLDLNGDDDSAVYHILHDENPDQINSLMIESLPEQNMANPNNLSNFVKKYIDIYQPNEIILDIWDHGSGWEGVCEDNHSSDGDYLTMTELESALRDIKGCTGRNIDLLMFDACVMQMIEVIYQIYQYVDIIVASEEAVPLIGYPYKNVVSILYDAPSLEEASIKIVDAYMEFYRNYEANPDTGEPRYSFVTLSTIKTQYCGEIVQLLNTLSQRLYNNINVWKDELIQCYNDVDKSYYYTYYVDIYDLLLKIKDYLNDEELNHIIENIFGLKDRCILKNGHFTNQEWNQPHPNFFGMTIVFYASCEITPSGLDLLQNYIEDYRESTKFAQSTMWDEFLLALWTSIAGGE